MSRPRSEASVPRRLATICAVLVLRAVPAGAAPSDERPRLALNGVQVGAGFDPKQAETVEQLFLQALQETRRWAVLGRPDIAALVGFERQRQMLGCADGSCVAELAGALGVELLATADVGRLGDAVVVGLRVLDARRGSVLGHAQRTVHADGEIPAAVRQIVSEVAGTSMPGAAPAAETVSSVPAAQLAWERSRQAWHDGADDEPALQEALAADPSIAAAHLFLALSGAWTGGTAWTGDAARRHFQSALAGRARLSPLQRELLDAFQPLFAGAPTPAGCLPALVAMTERHPDEAWPRVYVGRAMAASGDLPGALAQYRRAEELDPSFGRALMQQASTLMAGSADPAEAAEVLRRCARAAPRATLCLAAEVELASMAGRGAEVEQAARRMIALSPDDAAGYRNLAGALACQWAPAAALREAYRQQWMHTPEADGQREAMHLWADFEVAVDTGDLRGAEEIGRRILARVEEGTSVRALHAIAAHLVRLARETGREDAAVRVSRHVLELLPARSDASRAETECFHAAVAAGRDRAARMAGEARCDALLAERWRAMGTGVAAWKRMQVWVVGYATAPATPEQAERALAHLADAGPRGASGTEEQWVTLAVGRMLLLAGKPAEALPYLQRGARGCDLLGLERGSAQLDLGRALAAAGDAAGAREAFGHVVSMWGSARPRSVSADTARRELAALERSAKRRR